MCVIFLDKCWVGDIPFVRMVTFEFLAHLPMDHLAYPVMSSLSLSVLLQSLIMWSMVSSSSTHNLLLLFCCVLCILALIWFVLKALFCAAIRRDSVSLLKFPFLSHVQVLSCKMFISRLKHPSSCFPSHFCFLVIVILLAIVLSVSFLMAVITPPSCFSM